MKTLQFLLNGDKIKSDMIYKYPNGRFVYLASPDSEEIAVAGGELRNGEFIPKIIMDPKYAPNALLVKSAASHEGGHASTLNLEPKNSPYRKPEYEEFYLLVEKENPEITKAMEYNESLRPDIKDSALDELLLDETGSVERHINNIISSQEIRQRALVSEIDAFNKGVTMEEYINNPNLWDLNFKQLMEIFEKEGIGIRNYMKYFKSLIPITVGGSTVYRISKKAYGGKMNTLQFLKNGSGIHIKKENKGKFTDYCGGKVTSECISKGKRSSNPAIRKRATFADNARHFKHRSGGLILKSLTGTKLTPTEQLVKGWYDGTIGGIVKGIEAFLNLDNVRVGTGGFGGTGNGYGSGGISGHWKPAYHPKNNLNFNDAFDEAKKAGAETFIFGDKLYNTLSEANPIRERNNRYVGKGRTELIVRKRNGYGKDYGPFQTKLAGEQYAIKYLQGGFMSKVGNFLNSDYGKSIVNLGQLLYSGISDASNKIKQNEKLQKWKQSFINSQSLSDAERQKFYIQSILNQQMNNPDGNVSDIVASHDAWKLEQLELQKRKKEAEANLYITQMSLIDNNNLTGGFNFAGMASDILSGVLGNSKTQAITNPSSTYSLFKMPTTNFKVDMKL